MTRDAPDERPLIAVVGPCAAGKSMLVRALRDRGYNAREVVQEHSYVPAMWQRVTRPDVLIYVDVSERVARSRRPSGARAGWWDTLEQRLAHARAHADLTVDTDDLSSQQVVERVLDFLRGMHT